MSTILPEEIDGGRRMEGNSICAGNVNGGLEKRGIGEMPGSSVSTGSVAY